MKKNNSIDFLLEKIRTEQFALFEENFDANLEISLNTQVEFKLNQKNKMVGSFVGFTFEQEKKILSKIEVSCHFRLTENSWNSFIDKEKSKIVIPKGFLAHLAAVTLGTTRGVLFSKTEGTPLNNLIIPMLNISEIIQTDSEFLIEG